MRKRQRKATTDRFKLSGKQFLGEKILTDSNLFATIGQFSIAIDSSIPILFISHVADRRPFACAGVGSIRAIPGARWFAGYGTRRWKRERK
ncbi:MAG TPA: hypothetical protein VGD41_01295 [Pyrinomonadaceae bacterium]